MTQIEIVFELDQQLKALCKATGRGLWRMVYLARKLKNSQVWEKLGYDSWSAYLAQEDLSLQPSTIDDHIRTLDKMEGVGLSFNEEILQIYPSKARLIAPHLTKENSQELIAMAKTNSWSDLRENIRELNKPQQISAPPKPVLELELDGSREFYHYKGVKYKQYLRGLEITP